MTKIIATSKQRLIQFLDFQRIKRVDFFKKTGIKRGFLDSNKLNASITDIFLTKIIANYPELSITWLISGKGSMILPKNTVSEPEASYKKEDVNLIKEIKIIRKQNTEILELLNSSFIKEFIKDKRELLQQDQEKKSD